jgi:hypothetical protein
MKRDTFYSGIATACGTTGKIEELGAFLSGGDPEHPHGEPPKTSSEPFLRHILGPPNEAEKASVVLTPDGKYDIDAFFDED